MSSPMLVGDIMRQLCILREDGTVDLDMLAAHLRAEELHPDARRQLVFIKKSMTALLFL